MQVQSNDFMAQTSIITGQYVCIRQTAATVMQRFFAWVLDFIILCIFYYFAVMASYLMMISLNQFDSSETIAIMMEVVILLLPLLYPLLMEIYNDGKTIGKSLIGIKVTSLDGSKPSKTALTLRWLLYLVDFFCMGIGLIFVIFSKNSQRIGDLAAGTAVVKTERRKRPLLLKSYRYTSKGYRPTYPEAAALSMRQVEVMEHLIFADASPRRTQMMELLAEKVEHLLGIKDKENNTERFLTTIYNDFQYYAIEVV